VKPKLEREEVIDVGGEGSELVGSDSCDDIEDIPMVGKAGNPVKPPTPENAEAVE